jgi:predicted transcriptional regulator
MQSVLISIKPQWCELIASGKKTIEVRKTRTEAEATLASTKQVVASTVASEVHKPGGEQT